VVVYLSPTYPKWTGISALVDITMSLKRHEIPVIIFGDFNIERSSATGTEMEQLFETVGLYCRMPPGTPTNDYGNQIDLVFSTHPLDAVWIYESSQSDHKPIFFVTNAGNDSGVDR